MLRTPIRSFVRPWPKPQPFMLRTRSRFNSTIPPAIVETQSVPAPKPRKWTFLRASFLAVKYTGFLAGSTVVGVLIIGGAIFIHDAFTYSDLHIERVPVSPLAMRPQLGGPKKLPIAAVTLSAEENEENKVLAAKPRLVIVGGGWGAVGVLKTLSPNEYHVTVVSPETYNTFTPLLPSAAVGTIQVRSLMEPLRKLIARVRGQFVNGHAVDVVMNEQLLEVQTRAADGKTRNIYLPYDKLIVAVGSTSATHGVTGLENCFQLKTIKDARKIRNRVLENFEIASLPTTSEEERKRLLSFVVCGGGPTGVETAAEIFDLCQEDILKYYPKICREQVGIYLIQSRDHILNTYSENISQYAENKFGRDGVKVLVNARVKEVHSDKVLYSVKEKNEKGETKMVEHEIPANFVLWSTGIAMNPFTQRVSNLLPNQVHKKAIEVDSHLRVVGAPLGTIYAIGDAATIETSLVSHILELVEEADRDKDGKISFNEWEVMVSRIKKQVPMSGKHLEQVREIFERYDTDKDDSLSLNETAVLLSDIGNKITALPATAQVASQQGKYLGKKLSKIAKKQLILAANGIDAATGSDDVVSGAFEYRHLGSLAYIGNASVFDFNGISLMGGLAAMYAWRSIYWSEQVSTRTRALLMGDWIVRGIWGRDLSNL